MAKRGNSVIGIDLGKRAYKAVLLNKKTETRYALTSFASHEVPEDLTKPIRIDELALVLNRLSIHRENFIPFLQTRLRDRAALR